MDQWLTHNLVSNVSYYKYKNSLSNIWYIIFHLSLCVCVRACVRACVCVLFLKKNLKGCMYIKKTSLISR